jgi:hypothetical protein
MCENLCCSVFPSTTILFQVKGMCHEMDWNFADMHARDISRPKKGPRRDFKISRCSSSRKKIFLYILLGVNANLPPLDYVISMSLVKILFLLIGQGSRLLFSICWKNFLILRQHIFIIDQSLAA